MSEKPTTVDGYLETLPDKRRDTVSRIRSTILETIPEVEESMRYGMPTYDAAGDILAAVASQKHYISLYMNSEVVATHPDDLSHLNVGKSCIRFKKIEKLPLEVVQVMLKETLERNQSR